MKVIYFFLRRHCYTFDERVFQLSSFVSKGWELERWSAVNWTFEGLEKPQNIDESDGCFYIDNEKLLIENLERIKGQKCYFLIYPYDNTLCSWEIRKLIKRYGFKFANIAESLEIGLYNSTKPIYPSICTIISIECKKFLISCFSVGKSIVFQKSDFIKKIKKNFLNFWGCLLYKSDLNFITTTIYYYFIPNLYESLSKRNILIHAQSYDEAILCKKTIFENRKPFVVFIDQYLNGHSDFKKTGMQFPVTNLKEYCRKLCFLFDKIERDYNCEVIIAAHPKAEYNGDEFNRRIIVSGKTNSLIKDSLFVLIQTSTCFGLITTLKKSFINIYDSVFFDNLPSFKDYYIAIENVFHCKQLDIGNNEQVTNYKLYITEPNSYYENYNERYVISKEAIGTNQSFYEAAEEIVRTRI